MFVGGFHTGFIGSGCQLVVSCLSFLGGKACLVVPWGVSLGVQIEVHRASVGGIHKGVIACRGFIGGWSGVHWWWLPVVCHLVVAPWRFFEFLWWEGLFGGPLGCMFGGSNWGSAGVCWRLHRGL